MANNSGKMEVNMEIKNSKAKSKWVHWLARISTTFGLAGATWLYLYLFDLTGGVFLLGALCGLTAFEFLDSSPFPMTAYRKILLSLTSFLTPYLFHRILSVGSHRTETTILLFEVFLSIFIVITILGLRYGPLLKVVSKSLLFPVWGIALPMTALIFVAHFFVNLGRSSTEALLWVIVIILVTKATDIGALLVGSWIGKHKLAPKTSPAKTIEGAVGGVVISVLVAIVIYIAGNIKIHAVGVPTPIWWNFTRIIIATAVISIAGILGDLYESSWKRQNQIKNSGSILPGLGGMYDLTDSIILAAPVAYFMLKYVVITV